MPDIYGIIKVIFAVYIFPRIFHRRELRENMYSAKIYTFIVSVNAYVVLILRMTGNCYTTITVC